MAIAQSHSSRFGNEASASGTARLFIVFADVVDDPSTAYVPGWNPNELPRYKDSVVDYAMSNSLVSYCSRLFQDASFGRLNVIGDYYPTLLTFYSSEISADDKTGVKAVASRLDRMLSPILTAHGYELSDFDLWDLSVDYKYKQKPNVDNNNIDFLVVVWRHNSHFRSERSGGKTGRVRNTTIMGKGVDHYIVVYYDKASECLSHEFSHILLGGNEYHTGGAGAGIGHFLSNIGGYGILSSFNNNLLSCNAWDRWWLGWKPLDKQYYISALTTDGNDLIETETDLVYGEQLSNNEFILRNFLTSGDAIRIKFPYLKSIKNSTENQYLWIENHQILPQSIEYDTSKPTGIRFNIQIGNDDLYQYYNNSRTNYYVPLSCFGNYDFYYQYNPENVPLNGNITDYYTATTFSSKANPFSGYHLSMLPAMDFMIPHNDTIQGKEYVNVYDVYYNGNQILTGHPVFGNLYDVFPIGTTLSLATNPSATPLLTHNVMDRRNDLTELNIDAKDNRYIFLNGLRVDILEQLADGSIRVRIVWDDYDVNQDVRWCDSIVLNERVYLKPGKTITIDQGLTPVQATKPVFFNGEKIFADPTVFTCKNGSLFRQEKNSTVDVVNNSTLMLEHGSVYEIGDNAVLNIRDGATLCVKSGATLKVLGRGHVEVRNGGYICIEDGAEIILDEALSVVNLRLGHHTGLNPAVHGTTGVNCMDDLQEIIVHGDGHINVFDNDIWIQNETISSDRNVYGVKVFVGHHVTTEIIFGNVIIDNDATLIIDSEQEVLLDNGFQVEPGASLEVRRTP